MNALREPLRDYLAMRRALGFRLCETELLLKGFCAFMETRGQTIVTAKLALEWAMAPVNIKKYVRAAAAHCPSLKGKRVSPHVLRHSAAMELLAADVDSSVIALWLGHESVNTTQIYLHAHLALKEAALAKTTPFQVKPGRYRPADRLLQFLTAL